MAKHRPSILDRQRYLLAADGSRKLRARFKPTSDPFVGVIAQIDKSRSIAISHAAEGRAVLRQARLLAEQAGGKVAPAAAIPILLQIISEFYYGWERSEPSWLGNALKTTLALIWANLYAEQRGASQTELAPRGPVRPATGDSASASPTRLGDAVAAAGFFDQMQIFMSIYEIFEEGAVRISTDGFEQPPELAFAFSQQEAAFRDRGKILRTVADSASALAAHPLEALGAVENILRGEAPRSQAIFEGTIFHKIPPNEPAAFWAGLWARLHLLISAGALRNHLGFDLCGVAFIEAFNPPPVKGVDGALLAAAVQKLVWEPDWHARRLAEWPGNMIVERPIVPLSRDQAARGPFGQPRSPQLYAVGAPLIYDTLSWFVESSVMSYANSSGVPLSNRVFSDLISGPFETLIRDLFNRRGLEAGQVNEQGIWRLNDRDIPLRHKDGERIPGEVDVLAYDRINKIVYVAECKVLGLPVSANRMRNVFSKIGETDSEGFYAKLRRKLAWLQDTDVFAYIAPENFLGFVLLDRKLPGMIAKDGYRTFDTAMLDSVLAQMYGDKTG